MKNFFHFSVFNFEVKIEMHKNVLFHSNFKMKFEGYFQCTEQSIYSISFISQGLILSFKHVAIDSKSKTYLEVAASNKKHEGVLGVRVAIVDQSSIQF